MDKALGYLGLAARAGRLKIGAEDCIRQMQHRAGGLLVAASDAGGSTLAQAQSLCRSGGATLLRTAYTKRDLAQAVGRGTPVALVLICDEGLARAFASAADKQGEQEERV